VPKSAIEMGSSEKLQNEGGTEGLIFIDFIRIQVQERILLKEEG